MRATMFVILPLAVTLGAAATAGPNSDLERLKATGSCVNCDLQQASLRGLEMPDVNLSGSNLREADLKGVRLPRSKFREADLRRSEMEKADLKEADFRGALLRDADLEKSDITSGKFGGADLREAEATAQRPPAVVVDVGLDRVAAVIDTAGQHLLQPFEIDILPGLGHGVLPDGSARTLL